MPGLVSANACARSFRSPFSRPFQVSTGNKDTCSRSTVPGEARKILKCALACVWAGVRMTSYFFQSLELIFTSCEVMTCDSPMEALSISSTRIFWFSPLAHTLKRYFSLALIPMPKKPSFSMPVRLCGWLGAPRRT